MREINQIVRTHTTPRTSPNQTRPPKEAQIARLLGPRHIKHRSRTYKFILGKKDATLIARLFIHQQTDVDLTTKDEILHNTQRHTSRRVHLTRITKSGKPALRTNAYDSPLRKSHTDAHRFPVDNFTYYLTLSSECYFNFPSRYLFAIGLSLVFSLRWSLPPTLSCIPKQLDSWTRHY